MINSSTNTKFFIFIISLIILSTIGAYGQNANRNGAFWEVQGGCAFGRYLEIPKSNYDNLPNESGGVIVSLNCGYRFATSKHFAVDIKLGYFANLKESHYTTQIRLLPGIRWTSKDFNSNNSVYMSLNSGLGINPTKHFGIFIPFEFSSGLNFSSNLYAGIVFNYSLATGENWDIWENSHSFYEIYRHSYPTLGIQFGYRF